jgi:2-polyprenyl-3-methyl-5-hydroxy-6-metoxy-1,4-benzoquinol methylase
MTVNATSVPAEYFKRLYKQDADPWKFCSSDYERRKYADTMASLPRDRFDSVLDVGCSIGVLTRRLAARAEKVLGIDVDDLPLQQARARCIRHHNVSFAEMLVPAEWPEIPFDLIVLSEMLYYLSGIDIQQCAQLSMRSLLPGGIIVLVNWLGDTGVACTGDKAAELFLATMPPDTRILRQQRADQFRIDVLSPPSVGVSATPP